jgi:serine phosphatase RsbU (regulator of sigma subunit)
VVLIDTAAGTITYVDAAHGYGMLWDGGNLTPLRKGGGLPMGVFSGHAYTAETVPFPPGTMLVAVSDGIVEQPRTRSEDGQRQQFDVDGVLQVLRECDASGDAVAMMFDAVQRHAGTPMLADDATMVIAQRH